MFFGSRRVDTTSNKRRSPNYVHHKIIFDNSDLHMASYDGEVFAPTSFSKTQNPIRYSLKCA